MSHSKKSFQYGEHTVTIETGELARQADGAVLVSMSDTVVLVTAVGLKKPTPGRDFFPLTVNYQEKTYAAGRIPGGFFKREGRPTEKETLTSRLIDRPIRPLFPEGFINDVQVVASVLSVNAEVDPDIASLLGASAALAISGMPFLGPIGAARVGYRDGKYLLNPTATQLAESKLDLVVAGTAEGVLMVESEAKGLDEETMLGAVVFGHDQMQVGHQGDQRARGRSRQAEVELGRARGQLGIEVRGELLRREGSHRRVRHHREAAALRQDRRNQDGRAREARGRREREIHRRSSRRRILQSGISPGARADPAGTSAHRRARHQDRAAHQHPHRRARAHARLGAVHPRRDPGAGRDHARHRTRCADHRRADRRAQGAVHAPLQLPAVQRRRDRDDGVAEAPRDRSRQPRQARRQGGHAGSR